MTCHRKSHKRTCLPLASSNAPVDRTRKTMDKVKAVGWAVLVVLGQCVVQDTYQHVKALACAWLGM